MPTPTVTYSSTLAEKIHLLAAKIGGAFRSWGPMGSFHRITQTEDSEKDSSYDETDDELDSEISGGSFTVKAANGPWQMVSLAEDAAASFEAPSSDGPSACFVKLFLKSNGHSVTWPVDVLWANGALPSLSPTKTDILTFYYADGAWYGKLECPAADVAGE